MVYEILNTLRELSSAQIALIFIFIGFLYHYIQTSEYKNLIIGSILVGGIWGCSLEVVLTSDVEIILKTALICIVSFLIGGMIVVSIKKLFKRRAKPSENV